jgi:glycosyltransferase involved in cell wall biosynthesis
VARVLVGIPTRNRPHLVPKTIRSVLDQGFQDFRVVVSDNQSEPEARRAVEAFVRGLGDSRVRYHVQPEDRGEYGQGRYLFGDCREEYFTILHDDDVFAPDYLERAVRRLDAHPDLACFFANPWIFDVEDVPQPGKTAEYLAAHGRGRRQQGPMEILVPLLRWGFIPISGTFFRASALRASGLVDDDCVGSYPFEFNLLLRLGERGERAWFETEPLIGFCFQEQSLRNTLRLTVNPQVIETSMKILERRRFSGSAERLRRKILAYNCRNYAAIHLAEGATAEGRRYLVRALRLNPLSYRNWTYAAGALFAPFLIRSMLRSRIAAAP